MSSLGKANLRAAKDMHVNFWVCKGLLLYKNGQGEKTEIYLREMLIL